MNEALPEPHGNLYIRTSDPDSRGGGCLWQRLEADLWIYHNPVTGQSQVRSWTELAAGKYGSYIEMLVPVPYTAPDAGSDADIAIDRLVHHVLSPVANMMQQLASSAAAGVSAIVAEADQRGYRRGRAEQEPTS